MTTRSKCRPSGMSRANSKSEEDKNRNTYIRRVASTYLVKLLEAFGNIVHELSLGQLPRAPLGGCFNSDANLGF